MKKILWHAIKYDIREGILKKFPYFLLVAAVMLYFAVSSAMVLSNTQGSCSVADICVYLWRGVPKPVLRRGESIEIPIFYLLVHILILFFASYYPVRELKTKGRLLILFFRSRSAWWYGKCIWNFIGTFCIYLIFFLVICLCSVLFGGGFSLTAAMKEQLDGILLTDSSARILTDCFFTGFCILLAMNQMQVVMQLVLPPVVGFMLTMSVVIASFWVENPLLFGNYLMLCRTELFEGGALSPPFGCVCALFIWILCIFAGKLVIERKDF